MLWCVVSAPSRPYVFPIHFIVNFQRNSKIFQSLFLSLRAVHLIGLFKNHQDIHFKNLSNQLNFFLTFWSRKKSHFIHMYKIYRKSQKKATGASVERSPNEFFETKESERIVFDIHLVAHFRSILFLGNQNRFREIQKRKKNTTQRRKIRISEKKSYYSFFSSMSSLFTKLDSCIFFFFSSLFFEILMILFKFKWLFQRDCGKAKNILSWWLIVENIPRILILALGIKFEFSRLFANSLARASPQPHRRLLSSSLHPTNMNYRREKIDSNNEKWIYRIYARLGFFSLLCSLFFFLRERSDTNAVVVGVGSSSAARSYQAMVEHIFQEPDRRNCWLAQWTLINPDHGPMFSLRDQCASMAPSDPRREIHFVVAERCSWLMNVALFFWW